MEDKDKLYLDKVVEFLVRDTIIDYDNKKIKFPSYPSPNNFFIPFTGVYIPSIPTIWDRTYFRDVYGLTEEEITYVWKNYKGIILDKIKNER
jgi:hypothetical protein